MAIAIDGPAASGKSTTAKAVARKLGFHHVDSGSLYRAATAARARIDTNVENWTGESVIHAASIITLSPTEAGFTPLLGGKPAEAELRGDSVTSKVSIVAQMPVVRDWVNSLVRSTGDAYDVVVDGRDIGTVVLPHSQVKVFLIADPGERARRRLMERIDRSPARDEVVEETAKIVLRDEMDAAQSGQASDAVVIDTTRLSQEEQVETIVRLIEAVRTAD